MSPSGARISKSTIRNSNSRSGIAVSRSLPLRFQIPWPLVQGQTGNRATGALREFNLCIDSFEEEARLRFRKRFRFRLWTKLHHETAILKGHGYFCDACVVVARVSHEGIGGQFDLFSLRHRIA